MKIKEQIQDKLSGWGGDTILIHSDIMRGFEIPFKNRALFLKSHIHELISLNKKLKIWMPAFNYDFCKGKTYDVMDTPSQVGALTEHFRKEVAAWRTCVPVFSFAGNGTQAALELSGKIDPFSVDSAFHYLYENNGILMHYGSSMYSSTILHYAERISGRLDYRYDKLFAGKVNLANNTLIDVKFNFHVRPFGKHLDYNWITIENDLVENNILSIYKEGRSQILLCKIKDLVDYWVSRIRANPLYLLDNESKSWVEPLLEKLGRPFIITDFEIPEEL